MACDSMPDGSATIRATIYHDLHHDKYKANCKFQTHDYAVKRNRHLPKVTVSVTSQYMVRVFVYQYSTVQESRLKSCVRCAYFTFCLYRTLRSNLLIRNHIEIPMQQNRINGVFRELYTTEQRSVLN